MYKISYCIYSLSHFIKKPFSSHNDKWLGWKSWLNQKFCDKFIEYNDMTSKESALTEQQQNKHIQELNNLITAGANPEALKFDAGFNSKVEILPKNQYLMDLLRSHKFQFLSSYQQNCSLIRAITKTFTAKTIEEMKEGKFAIEYLVSQNKSVKFPMKDELGKAWIMAVKLIAKGDLGTLYKSVNEKTQIITMNKPCSVVTSSDTQINQIRDTTSEVINILYQANQDIVSYQDNDGNNAMHILASAKNSYGRFDAQMILTAFKSELLDQLKPVANKEGYNALHLAVIADNYILVNQIFDACPSEQRESLLSAKNRDGNNILHLAVKSDNLDIVNAILQKCNDEQRESLLSAKNRDGNNILHLAVKSDNLDIVNAILQKCNDEQKQKLLTDTNSSKYNPLHLAVGKNTLFDMLLKEYTDDHKNNVFLAQDVYKNNILHLAIKSGNLQIVNTILQACNAEQQRELFAARNFYQETPTIIAMNVNSSPDFLQQLIQYNSPSDLSLLLETAIHAQNVTVIKLVLGKIDNLNITLRLYDSIISQSTDIIGLLIKHGVNITNYEGDSPLHIAVRGAILRNDFSKVNQLIEMGADVCIANKQNHTPLHIMVINGNPQNDRHIKTFEMLLEHADQEISTIIYPMIMKRMEVTNYENLKMLSVFATHLANKGILLEMADEQLQCLIHKKKNNVAEDTKEKKVLAVILKAFYVNESIIPQDIKKLMDNVELKQGPRVPKGSHTYQEPLPVEPQNLSASEKLQNVEFPVQILFQDNALPFEQIRLPLLDNPKVSDLQNLPELVGDVANISTDGGNIVKFNPQ